MPHIDSHFGKPVRKGRNVCELCCTKIQEFSVNYGKSEIIKDVNLHVHCGEITAIAGPNGAGKSTLLKAILGEIKHDGTMDFLDIKGERTGKPLIGYVPQDFDFDKSSPVSVRDIFTASMTNFPFCMIRFISSANKAKQITNRIKESLKLVKAEHLIDKKLGSLSGGEFQRVMLALALTPLPDLLLLDEPVSAIDQAGLELFYQIVSELRQNFDLSVILVSHDLSMIYQHADRVIVLNKTIVADGKPKQVFSDRELLKKLFGSIWISRKGEFFQSAEEEGF